MPNYYNYNPYQNQNYYQPPQYQYNAWTPQSNMYGNPMHRQPNQWMINVDGEVGAKAWQMPNDLPPNTVIPLFDLDGEHIYFRSVDSYGRMNPLRKGRVVFEDEQQNLMSGSAAPERSEPQINTENFVTKEDLNELKNEIHQMFANNQNGNPVPAPQNRNQRR